MDEIVDLRPDASTRVDNAVGNARNEYYGAADIINGLFRDGGLSIQDEQRSMVEGVLRIAATRIHKCIVLLESIEAQRN